MILPELILSTSILSLAFFVLAVLGKYFALVGNYDRYTEQPTERTDRIIDRDVRLPIRVIDFSFKPFAVDIEQRREFIFYIRMSKCN